MVADRFRFSSSEQEERALNGDRASLVIGTGSDWLGDPERNAARTMGRDLLHGCLVDQKTASTIADARYRAWVDAQPNVIEDPPAWAAVVAPPPGFRRTVGKLTLYWDGTMLFVERWAAADGREVTVHQTTPERRDSPDAESVELAPGVRVREMSTADNERAVTWTTGVRTVYVHVNTLALAHLNDVVLELHRAANERLLARTDRQFRS